jgi:hypothetical protein
MQSNWVLTLFLVVLLAALALLKAMEIILEDTAFSGLVLAGTKRSTNGTLHSSIAHERNCTCLHQEAPSTTNEVSEKEEPIVYFILTACLTKSPNRCSQYARGVESLRNQTAGLNKTHKIMIVEGNGKQNWTCLDDLGVEVLYTRTNMAKVDNYGIKEHMDVMASIEHLKMKHSDLVVKMTGRYYLPPGGSAFMKILNDIHLNETRGIVKFGPYMHPENERMDNCVTGLIMLPVSTIAAIGTMAANYPKESVERHWGSAATLLLPESQVVAVQGKLGIFISPRQDNAFYLV